MKSLRITIGSVALLTVCAVSACSAAGGDRAPVGAPPTKPVPSASAGNGSAGSSAPAVPPTANPTTPPAVPAVGGTGRCHTADLTGHVDGGGAGAGQRYGVLALTNHTATTCRVFGFPGLQLMAADGQTLRTNVIRNGAAPTLLMVRPGQTVWSLLQWTVIPADDEVADNCGPNPVSLRVIPPDETTQLSMPFTPGQLCQHGQIFAGAFTATRAPNG
ncbi:MAG: hypothetical protein QOI74_669 [Micromonosporaceae bacterium]|nr:hypothetical protein [Micromonosporaceae bacterium]